MLLVILLYCKNPKLMSINKRIKLKSLLENIGLKKKKNEKPSKDYNDEVNSFKKKIYSQF